MVVLSYISGKYFMKKTLSLKKSLSFEPRTKISQKIGATLEVNQQKESAKKEQLKKGIEWLVKTYLQCFDPYAL